MSGVQGTHKKPEYAGKVDQEMEAAWAVVKVAAFLDKFLPVDDASVDLSENRVQEIGERLRSSMDLRRISNETQMYPHLVSSPSRPFLCLFMLLAHHPQRQQCTAIDAALEGTNYLVKDTGERPEDGFEDYKPDLSVFSKNYREFLTVSTEQKVKLAIQASEDESKAQTAKLRQKWRSQNRFAYLLSLVEVKLNRSADPFGKSSGQKQRQTDNLFLHLSGNSQSSRAQMIKYAVGVMVRQHRTHLFTVFITRDKARLMRWDRCGAVVSTEFDYLKEPKWLLNFFRRLALLSPAMQGYDTSVQPATEEQISELDAFICHVDTQTNTEGTLDNDYLKKFLKEMNEDRPTWPIMQVRRQRITRYDRSNICRSRSQSP